MSRLNIMWLIIKGLLIMVLSGCTINIYHEHGQTPDSSLPADSLLIVPPDSREPTQYHDGVLKSASDILTMSVGKTGSLDKADGGSRVESADAVTLTVESSVDAYLNCYYRQANGDIVKVFPSRFTNRYWVYAGQQLAIPDSGGFQIIADGKGLSEGFMCLASSEDTMTRLPLVYQANVFQTLPAQSFDHMYSLYRRTTEANLVGRVVAYRVH